MTCCRREKIGLSPQGQDPHSRSGDGADNDGATPSRQPHEAFCRETYLPAESTACRNQPRERRGPYSRGETGLPAEHPVGLSGWGCAVVIGAITGAGVWILPLGGDTDLLPAAAGDARPTRHPLFELSESGVCCGIALSRSSRTPNQQRIIIVRGGDILFNKVK